MSVADLAAAPWADAVMGAACTVNVALARPRGGIALVAHASLALTAVVLVARALCHDRQPCP